MPRFCTRRIVNQPTEFTGMIGHLPVNKKLMPETITGCFYVFKWSYSGELIAHGH